MKTVQPSVFDRLTDPSLADRDNHRYSISAAAKRVEDDLVDLMKTKQPRAGTFDGLTLVEKSIANFGLPDVSHGVLESPDRRWTYRDEIRDIIQTYEPRLTDIQVDIPSQPIDGENEKPDARPNILHFRIQAKLNLFPDTVENVVFDSHLNLSTGEHEVQIGANS